MYSTDTEIKLDVLTRELRQEEEEDKQSQEQQSQTLSQEQDEEVEEEEEEEEVYDEGVDTEDFNPMDSFIELPWPPSQWY